VIGPSELVLLDTTVVVDLFRGNAAGQQIDADYQLKTRKLRPLISVVTVGEVRALARRLNWGKNKINVLDQLLAQLVEVDLSNAVVDRYALIDAHVTSNGTPIGENDTWIAATAATAGAVLLTSDKDFDVLAADPAKKPWEVRRVRVHAKSGVTLAT